MFLKTDFLKISSKLPIEKDNFFCENLHVAVEDSKDHYRGNYSDYGGHKERSDFWKLFRKKLPGDVIPDKSFDQIIRRSMPRIPKDGKTPRG